MGKGDRRGRKSKIIRGTHGKTRLPNRTLRRLRRLKQQMAPPKG